MGGDTATMQFQSTLPLRGATETEDLKNESNTISIHAPLTGSDLFYSLGIPSGFHFNPRSPYGERLATAASRDAAVPFQSTLPLRGATAEDAVPPEPTTISIHAPLTGSDTQQPGNGCWIMDFNPRSPYGERLRFLLIY